MVHRHRLPEGEQTGLGNDRLKDPNTAGRRIKEKERGI